MKIRILTLIFSISLLIGCSSHKDVSTRMSYMMPKKADMPRNTKYVSPKAKKTYKVTNGKTTSTKKYYAQ